MLHVSLVRQSETLLFYVVTSRIEALVVPRHKFLNACVEKVYRLLFFGTHLAQSFRKCRCLVTTRCTVFRDTFGKNFGQIRDGEASVFVDFHLNLLYEIWSQGAGWPLRCCRARYLDHFQTATPSLDHTVTHHSFSIDLTHLSVNISWLDILGL